MRIIARIKLLGGMAFGLLLASSSASAVSIYSSGHADISATYEEGSGEFKLNYRFSEVFNFEDGTELLVETKVAPDGAATRVGDPPFARPPGSDWDFLGVAADELIWFNPEIQEEGKPFHGFATDELNSSDWVGGRDTIAWTLASVVSRPIGGEISLFQVGPFGNPLVRVDTIDGLGADDVFNVIFGHAHYAWGFTTPGVYRLEFTATGAHVTDGAASGSGVFTFYVGNSVPEPSSLCLAIAGCAATACVAEKRRRRKL